MVGGRWRKVSLCLKTGNVKNIEAAYVVANVVEKEKDGRGGDYVSCGVQVCIKSSGKNRSDGMEEAKGKKKRSDWFKSEG